MRVQVALRTTTVVLYETLTHRQTEPLLDESPYILSIRHNRLNAPRGFIVYPVNRRGVGAAACTTCPTRNAPGEKRHVTIIGTRSSTGRRRVSLSLPPDGHAEWCE